MRTDTVLTHQRNARLGCGSRTRVRVASSDAPLVVLSVGRLSLRKSRERPCVRFPVTQKRSRTRSPLWRRRLATPLAFPRELYIITVNRGEPMNELTARQAEVLQLIADFLQATGFPPTRAEIAKQLGFRSANAAED